jgi:hypothetical protein
MKVVTTNEAAQRFKQANRNDRIRLCRFNDALWSLLSNDETDYYKACHTAFHLIVDCVEERDAIAAVQETIPYFETYYKAKQLIANALYIYNDVFTFNKQLENYKYVHQQKDLAQQAKAFGIENQCPKLLEVASRALERAAKAGGYDTPTIEQDATELPKYVLITSNQRLLEANKNNESLTPKQLVE